MISSPLAGSLNSGAIGYDHRLFSFIKGHLTIRLGLIPVCVAVFSG
jgi:hypothetical protein